MSVDADGYGPRPHQADVERLLEDTRTLSPSSIERVAQAWMRMAGPGWSERVVDHRDDSSVAHTDWVEAERAALHSLEVSHRAPEWDELRNSLLELTEHHQALVAWRQEHGEAGHRAEDALLAAGLALVARAGLDTTHLRTLLAPMGAALPWLKEIAPS